MSESLEVGDLVRKRAGYEYRGIIVSVFMTRAGAVRYVVEADHPGFAGMLHIFNGEQLEPRVAPLCMGLFSILLAGCCRAEARRECLGRHPSRRSRRILA